MYISPLVLRAGAILSRAGKACVEPLTVMSAHPEIGNLLSPQRMLVAGEIRSLLEREDIRLILAVFDFFRDSRPHVIGGSEIGKNGERAEYGFDSQGPFRAMFKTRYFGPKSKPLAVERISPEELLAHTRYPELFLRSIHRHMEVAAQAILKERNEERESLRILKNHGGKERDR
jgi:hypothetical protein